MTYPPVCYPCIKKGITWRVLIFVLTCWAPNQILSCCLAEMCCQGAHFPSRWGKTKSLCFCWCKSVGVRPHIVICLKLKCVLSGSLVNNGNLSVPLFHTCAFIWKCPLEDIAVQPKHSSHPHRKVVEQNGLVQCETMLSSLYRAALLHCICSISVETGDLFRKDMLSLLTEKLRKHREAKH